MTDPRIVAVIQARMGSTRLPGKVLSEIEGVALLAWTIRGVQAIPGVTQVVVATTTESSDDPVRALADGLGVATHRGSVHDVLARCHDAVAPFHPDVVVRQTGDNPFPDPTLAERQLATLIERDLDYVGIDGWPLCIAAEACRFSALAAANRAATDPADREHVLPLVYRQPDGSGLGWVAGAAARRPAATAARYTVDTDADLAFARALGARLGHGAPVNLAELESIIEAEPELLVLNAGIAQKSHREAQAAEGSPWTS